MSIEQSLADAFRPEERNKGSALAAKDVVGISSESDTHVRAFIKGSTACKVTLTAEDVASPSFTAECSCPPSRKGILCKHLWAVLLKLEGKESDFIVGKTSVNKVDVVPSAASKMRNEFKKQQYEKQKARAKEMRREKKKADSIPQVSFPEPVQEALRYFRGNGFPLDPPEMGELQNARRLLARVFHPDKGGTHDEIIALTDNFEVLRDYLNG
ncbi:MAG: SWIM zinc finger family protein [Bdellovibrionales bacterium]|nr:SWIM zinc finger family protein [Bdellovibrionales bacterium]